MKACAQPLRACGKAGIKLPDLAGARGRELIDTVRRIDPQHAKLSALAARRQDLTLNIPQSKRASA
jgi:hypothetical protein